MKTQEQQGPPHHHWSWETTRLWHGVQTSWLYICGQPRPWAVLWYEDGQHWSLWLWGRFHQTPQCVWWDHQASGWSGESVGSWTSPRTRNHRDWLYTSPWCSPELAGTPCSSLWSMSAAWIEPFVSHISVYVPRLVWYNQPNNQSTNKHRNQYHQNVICIIEWIFFYITVFL